MNPKNVFLPPMSEIIYFRMAQFLWIHEIKYIWNVILWT